MQIKYKFCAQHGCGEPRSRGSFFCKWHREAGNAELSVEVTWCIVDGCMGQVCAEGSKLSEYCARHICNMKDCWNSSVFDLYCSIHSKCVYCAEKAIYTADEKRFCEVCYLWQYNSNKKATVQQWCAHRQKTIEQELVAWIPSNAD